MTYSDALLRYSIEDLQAMANRWGVDHSADDKEGLARKLTEFIPKRLTLWASYTRERYFVYLKAILANSDRLPDAPEVLDDLIHWGMVYMVKTEEGDALVVPSEVAEVMISLLENSGAWDQTRLNEDIMELTAGLVILYGVLPLEAAESLLRMQYLPFIEMGHLEKLLATEEAKDDFIGQTKGLLHEVDIPNPEDVMKEVLEAEGLPYATFDEKLVRLAGQLGDMPFDRKEQVEASELLHKKLGGELEQVEMVLQISMHRYNMNTPLEEVLDPILDGLDIQSEGEYKQIANVLVDALGATPNWSLKGHRPSEISDWLDKQPAVEHGHRH